MMARRMLEMTRRTLETTRPTVALAAIAVVAAACATGTAPTGAPGAPGPRAPARAGGSAGFDTRTYPGDSVMTIWYEHSPYEWVGYYLPAPCYTGTSWVGRRATLRAAKWGLAVVFIGEQDWSAAAPEPAVADTLAVRTDTSAAPPGGLGADSLAADSVAAAAPAAATPRCTRTNLSAEKGAADAAVADSTAAAEGFEPGTTIFLDVERVDSVSTPLARYVRSWVEAVLRRGRYTPGIYAHALNADSLRAIQLAAFPGRPSPEEAPFWVSRPGETFTTSSVPVQSGFAYASVWQGAIDRYETWGGITLRIDVNVATTPTPSHPDRGG